MQYEKTDWIESASTKERKTPLCLPKPKTPHMIKIKAANELNFKSTDRKEYVLCPIATKD